MKKVFKYITASFLFFGMASCSKNLEIEPSQSIDLGSSFQNELQISQGITGVYSQIAEGSLYGTNLLMIPDLQSSPSYSQWIGTFTTYREIQNYVVQPRNQDITRTWNQAYSAINLANVLLDVLNGENASTIVPDAESRTAYIGELEFLRGVLHFELVRYYGQQYDATTVNTPGVVISLTGKTDAEQASEKPVRSTVGEVYTQILSDLNSAAEKLSGGGKYADRNTVLAFLARVYLQQNNYEAARDAADEVINSGVFTLPSNNLNNAWENKNTSEVVFEIQQNEQNNAGTSNDGLATFYASTDIGRGDMIVNPGFVDSYPAGDKRVNAWYYEGYNENGNPGNINCYKWYSFFQNIPVIRIAEMYLIRAETNLRLGTTVGATPAEDLAVINNPARTGVAVIADPTLDDVLDQRKWELSFEGVTIHDKKRMKQDVGPANKQLAWNDKFSIFPIPQREVDATQGSLQQNEGY